MDERPGSALLAALLVGWSVWNMGRVNADAPTQLVTDGAYAHSRNPMYAGWTVAHAGVLLLVNSLWLLVLFPVALVVTHLVVRGEEQSLERAFGDDGPTGGRFADTSDRLTAVSYGLL